MLLFLLSRKENLVYSRFHSYSIRLYYSIVCRPLNNINKSSENTLIVSYKTESGCMFKRALKSSRRRKEGGEEGREGERVGRKEGGRMEKENKSLQSDSLVA